ncbi:MAG TPA: ABC transporter ATP-binding protein [Myxococcota bacterium]|nr:ABC transporter ATP-binding protein [Myxococcota bacterium]
MKAIKIGKTFRLPTANEVLKEISLELFPWETVAIMGPSGEGKSTLLNILGTLEPPTSGELILLGQKVTRGSAPLMRNQHIGFIFQSFNLLEDYTVLQNVLMPAFIANKPTATGSFSYKRALTLLESVGLSHRVNHMSQLLSGGEKQRVAIARALCNDPQILLADEPSGNLDRANSFKIFQLLAQAVKDFGKGLIIVTHDKELAKLCDRRFLLSKGSLTELGKEYG